MKRKLVFFALAMTALLLGGCAQEQAQMEYIGADAAKQLALKAAGLSAGQVEFSGTDMGTRNGMDYYQVSFTAGGGTYQYDIEALTGTVIESQVPERSQAADAAQNGQSAQPPEGSLVTDADTYGPTTQAGQGTQAAAAGDDIISVEEAKAAALAHANLSADQVTFVKSGLDWDDGQQTYDLEFYTRDYTEYDYDIDPYTGAVLSYDHDAEYYTPPAGGGGSAITAEQAKALALAQVPGATVDNIWEFEVDYDDGRLEYEGAIFYNHMEYEFEIDGYSGAIRSWEVESIYD